MTDGQAIKLLAFLEDLLRVIRKASTYQGYKVTSANDDELLERRLDALKKSFAGQD